MPPNEAAASLNASYLGANEGALKMTKTTSASLLRMRGKATKQFVLRPGRLDFGTVKLGQVCSSMASLTTLRTKNVSKLMLHMMLHMMLPKCSSCQMQSKQLPTVVAAAAAGSSADS